MNIARHRSQLVTLVCFFMAGATVTTARQSEVSAEHRNRREAAAKSSFDTEHPVGMSVAVVENGELIGQKVLARPT